MHCVQYALIYDYLQLMPQYEIAECACPNMILLMVKEEYCTDNWNNRADSTHKTISTLFVGLGDSRVERHGGNIYFRVSSTSVADPEPDSDLFPDPDKMDPIRPGNSSSFHISKQKKTFRGFKTWIYTLQNGKVFSDFCERKLINL